MPERQIAMRQILMSGRLTFVLFFVFSKKCFAKYKYQVQTKTPLENGWKNIAQIDLDVTSLRVLTMAGNKHVGTTIRVCDLKIYEKCQSFK